jgi:hypothetical protein
MSFFFINIFLHSWFGKQNANESSIHLISSQQNTNKLLFFKTVIIIIFKTDKNIEKVIDRPKKKKKLNCNLIYDKLWSKMTLELSQWWSPKYSSYINQFLWNIFTEINAEVPHQ